MLLHAPDNSEYRITKLVVGSEDDGFAFRLQLADVPKHCYVTERRPKALWRITDDGIETHRFLGAIHRTSLWFEFPVAVDPPEKHQTPHQEMEFRAT